MLELLAAKSREKKDAAQALSKAARDRLRAKRLSAKRRAAGAASDDDFFDDELSGTEREDGGSDAENSDDDAGQVLEKLASEHAGRSASASVPKDDEELRLRCIESWTRDAHYAADERHRDARGPRAERGPREPPPRAARGAPRGAARAGRPPHLRRDPAPHRLRVPGSFKLRVSHGGSHGGDQTGRGVAPAASS